jgi:hypothetical protein
MSFILLQNALDARRREHADNALKLSRQYDYSEFGMVASELLYSLETWQQGTRMLYNPTYWNFPALIDSNRRKLRRPHIRLFLERNQRQSLILLWEPTSDFILSWQWVTCSRQERMLIKLDYFYTIARSNSIHLSYLESEQYLIEAVQSHLGQVYDALAQTFDVEVVTDLYLNYEPDEQEQSRTRFHIPKRRALTNASIRQVKEESAILHEQAVCNLLKQKFDEDLGVSPELVLKAFHNSGYKLGATEKAVSQATPKPVSQSKIRARLQIVFEQAPQIFTRFCPDAPEKVYSHWHTTSPGDTPLHHRGRRFPPPAPRPATFLSASDLMESAGLEEQEDPLLA